MSEQTTEQEWTDRDDALEWDPTSSVGGNCYTEGDTRKELACHLPSGWAIAEFDIWGPRRTNHGGPVGYEVTIEHEDGATISIAPASTLSRHSCRIVYNSHKIWRTFPTQPRQLVRDPQSMVRRSHPATIFAVVVELAQEFANRFEMWHTQDP